MKMKFLLFISVCAATVFVACKKEAGSTNLRVRMTDAPASYEEVNVDLEEVKIKFESDTSMWLTMPTVAGIYNLLELQNGVDTLISEAVYPAGRIKEIRLVLGSENSIKSGGEVYPLTIPSGSESGLKIKIDRKIDGPVDSLVIDFDAAMSVTQDAEGYKLRPVIKLLP